MRAMDFTRQIEQRAIELFLPWYNEEHGTSFRVVEHGDAPESGATLNVEITLMRERGDDIQALRGRTNTPSIDSLRAQNALVAAGLAHPLQFVRTPQVDALSGLATAIRKKLTKSYGPNTALLIRETCPLDWDWGLVDLSDVRVRLREHKNPFDKGIWLIESTNRLRRVM